MSPIARKISGYLEKSSWIRRMFEEGDRLRAKHGAENVFDFSIGNPVVEPPPRFRQILMDLMSEPPSGLHRYMSNAGYPETRAAVASRVSAEQGVELGENHIIMTVGAAGACNVVLKALLDPQDEVVIFAPYFVEYIFYTENASGKARVVETDQGFNLDLEALAAALGPRTKAVIINTPNNPTGRIYSASTLRDLGQVLEEANRRHSTQITLISDEPYRKIVYDQAKVPSIFQVYRQSIVLSSHSKDLGLPGERIGYIALNPQCSDVGKLVAALCFCNRTLGFVNAPALMQRLVAHLQEEIVDLAAYQRNRDAMVQVLAEAGLDATPPQGAFYLFPPVPGGDDVAFITALKEHNVLAVPGLGFGRAGYVRFCTCVEESTIWRSAPAIKAAMASFKG